MCETIFFHILLGVFIEMVFFYVKATYYKPTELYLSFWLIIFVSIKSHRYINIGSAIETICHTFTPCVSVFIQQEFQANWDWNMLAILSRWFMCCLSLVAVQYPVPESFWNLLFKWHSDPSFVLSGSFSLQIRSTYGGNYTGHVYLYDVGVFLTSGTSL